MTESQLIDGFTGLYRSLYSAQNVYKKLKGVYSRSGLSTAVLSTVAFNSWSMYDARRKEKALNRNKRHVEMLKRSAPFAVIPPVTDS